MNRKIAAALCVVLCAAMLLGACSAVPEAEDTSTPGPIPDNDQAIVVAEVNGEPIYRSEYLMAYESMSSGVDLSDPEMAEMMQQMTIDTLTSEEVMIQNIEALGYMDLTDEEEQQANDEAQAQLDMFAEYSMAQIESELGEDYTEEELAAAVEAFKENALTEIDMTMEEFVDYFHSQLGVQKAMEALVGDIEPTEDEIRAYYDSKLAQDQELYTDPAMYMSAEQQGQTTYFVPEGLRMVRHVLIKLDDDAVSEIMGLRATDDAAADELLEEKLADIQEEADMVLEQLQADEITFNQAIEQYNADPGMESYPEGYMVCEGATAYVQSFTDGAMSLEKVGDFTELVASDYGYHIIEYTSNVESETTAFEDVKEDIYNEMTPGMQEQAWAEMVDTWKQESDVVTYEDQF